jgi:hypothetical protein
MSFSELKTVKSQSAEITASQIAKDNSASDQTQGTGNMGTAAKEEAPLSSGIFKEAKANVDSMGYRVGDNEGIPL